MNAELVWSAEGERIFVLVLAAGEEAFSAITEFATEADLSGASLTALGAFERATVGWFDLKEKIYKPIEIAEQCEALSLVGDVATGDDGKPTTRGGHLLQATVRPTLEVTIVESPAHLRRRKRPELGIALIDLG